MTLKDRLRLLYEGRSARATRFRYALLAFDAVSIVFFLATAMLDLSLWLLIADGVIGVLILLDLLGRAYIAENRWRHLRQFYVMVDIVVILSLLAAPFIGQGLMMLRLLRALRLVHSYHLLRDLRRDWRFFRRHEDTVVSAVNLLVFIFAMTALVYVMRPREPALETYVDALYFTVATLTTTGFGDIAMTTTYGRLLAVVIMAVGVGLFLRLASAIFSPAKVRQKCEQCGLMRHDSDAIYCKHCGAEMKIETEGVG